MKIESPVAILGFGNEGQYALDFLMSQEVKDITVCDEKADIKVPEGIKILSGENAFSDFTSFSTVIRSPGVNNKLKSLAEAADSGVIVTSLTQLTMEACSERVTAITGTNGKTTTTALCEQILSAHYGSRLIVGGNDRKPVLKQVLEHEKDPVLMEVSSFQFADLTVSPYISAILNITPNHLDWHEDFEEYVSAKTNLLCHQKYSDWAILNANDENTAKLGHATPAQKFWIGEKKGENWAVWEDGFLRTSFNGELENVLHFDQINIKTHPENLLVAAAVAKLHFVPVSTTEEQIKLFKGVEHRLEFVRTVKDIHFFNDSSSTSPESAMAAIDQFVPSRLILLLGGSSKKADFSFLAAKIAKERVRVYLYGKEGQTIKEALLSAGAESLILEHDYSGDIEKIITKVFGIAKPQDSIVLSPACASFDMFKDAKDRGLQFKSAVNGL